MVRALDLVVAAVECPRAALISNRRVYIIYGPFFYNRDAVPYIYILVLRYSLGTVCPVPGRAEHVKP